MDVHTGLTSKQFGWEIWQLVEGLELKGEELRVLEQLSEESFVQTSTHAHKSITFVGVFVTLSFIIEKGTVRFLNKILFP